MAIRYGSGSNVIEIAPESRGGQIVAEMNARKNCFWEAYDEGRMAHAMGKPMLASQSGQWKYGWNAEANRI